VSIAPVSISDFHSLQHHEVTTELDSHADTCVVGRNCLITHTYDKKVNVSGYDPKLGTMKGMSIVSAALAYDDPSSGEVFILRVHQAVHIPTMENNLLCPMQMRVNDVTVDKCPKFLHSTPTDTTHTIIVQDDTTKLVIPLSLRGVTSYFPTRVPTALENEDCRSFDLTFTDPVWNPQSRSFERQEEAQVDSKGRVWDPGDRPSRFISSSSLQSESHTSFPFDSQCAAVLINIEPALNEDIFARMLRDNVCVASTTTSR
jgi:hypothetical protein